MSEGRNASTRDVLTQALAYLAAVRGSSIDAKADAAVVADWLAGQGLGISSAVHRISGLPSPATLRAMREDLGLTAAQLAQEAKVSERTIYCAERPSSRAHKASVEAIAAVLDRLKGGCGSTGSR